MENDFITVVTPTYNREKLLVRVWNSLQKQTYKNFEWIVIDDGSMDNTRELIAEWKKKSPFNIIYEYQENSGKHIAVNRAVEMAKGKWIVIADSDDSFREDAFEILISEYYKIPEKERDEFKGITCRCYNEEQNGILGDDFPNDKYVIDCKEDDFKYKLHIKGELWGITKTEIMKENPFPIIEGIKFFPESIIWDSIAKKYKTRYINEPLRYYFRDAENSITTSKVYSSYYENYYLWIHNINNNSKYILHSPKVIIKSYIGFNMDTKFCNIKYKESLKKINTIAKKVVCILLYPIGSLAYYLKKKGV